MIEPAVPPGLAGFFGAIDPFLRGRASLADVEARLGRAPTPDGLAFYRWLVAVDQQRILAELYPAAKAWIERAGLGWDAVCAGFVAAHPPAGWSVPHVGHGFADWLDAEPVAGQPAGIAAVADLAWTRFLARTAPDGPGLGLDRRVFVRMYPIDAVATHRALLHGDALPPARPTAIVVYRHAHTDAVHERPASLATIAVLVALAGVAGPDLDVSAAERADERARLVAHGVVP